MEEAWKEVVHPPPIFQQLFRPWRRRRCGDEPAAAEARCPGGMRSHDDNLHAGSARTTLLNYLFSNSRGGKFILWVEDTDLEGSTNNSEGPISGTSLGPAWTGTKELDA